MAVPPVGCGAHVTVALAAWAGVAVAMTTGTTTPSMLATTTSGPTIRLIAPDRSRNDTRMAVDVRDVAQGSTVWDDSEGAMTHRRSSGASDLCERRSPDGTSSLAQIAGFGGRWCLCDQRSPTHSLLLTQTPINPGPELSPNTPMSPRRILCVSFVSGCWPIRRAGRRCGGTASVGRDRRRSSRGARTGRPGPVRRRPAPAPAWR